MLLTIADLKQGQKGIIKEFDDELPPIKLLELGCLPGNEVELVQIAPLNDPIYINVNGSHIAIRKQMAERIALEGVEEAPEP
ncbi:MAG: ferrous iron transport protein A [Flavobacteriaceae bacterium]|nr:ferrous iron transport protein A [Flavobacteriaceae bacterium]